MKRLITNSNTKFAQTGFTLVELIVTLAVGALLMTQVVPSFQEAIKESRLTTETNKLVADINLARSEAIKRGTNLVVCATDDPKDPNSGCNDSTDWSTGWVVFADNVLNGSLDAGDTLIRVGHGQATNSDVTLTASAASLTYTLDGLNDGGVTKTVTICDDRAGDFGRQISVNPTGRPRLVTPIACGA